MSDIKNICSKNKRKINSEIICCVILAVTLIATVILNGYVYYPEISKFICDDSLLIVNNDSEECRKGLQIQTNALSNVPSDVMEYLKDNRWTIQITDELIQNYITQNNWEVYQSANISDIVGITQFTDRMIVLNISSSDTLEYSTLHEVAHVFDYAVGKQGSERPQESKEFENIFNAERSWAQE